MLIVQTLPVLGRAFSSIMTFCRPLVGFIIKVIICLHATFICHYKNGVYLQECFAAFIWGVENIQGGLRILRSNFLRIWFVHIESIISQKYVANPHLFWLLLKGKDIIYPIHGWFWKL